MSVLRTLLDQRGPHDDPLLMAVVNVTPDSFSDGGQFFQAHSAFAHVDRMLEQGAQIIDVGGESTRPGSAPVPAEEQIRRTREVVRYAARQGALVSIDTTLAPVAKAALEEGARIINDVSCLRESDALARLAAAFDASLVLMHAREPMSEMKGFSVYKPSAYQDVVKDVMREWSEAAQRAVLAGLSPKELVFDPGLGFNKNASHSAQLIARLPELLALGYPVLMGPSRKSFVAAQVPSTPSQRLGGTVAACLACAARGAALLRVHEVLEVRQALSVARAVGLLSQVPTALEEQDA